MSDSAAPGPGAADALQPDNPTPAQVPADNGSSNGLAKTWLDGLSGDNRKLAESKGWKSDGDIDKVFTSYAELEKYRGQSVKLPAEDAPAEEWADFQSKLPASMRAPESPDKYDFKIPEGLPPDLPYDDGLAAKSKDWMHKAGLPPDKAQAVHDGFVTYMAEQHKAQAEAAALARRQAVETTHDALVKDWGPLGSEGFNEKHGLADRAARKLVWVDALKRSGILLENGDLTDADFAKGLYAVGDSMFREDTIEANGGVPPGVNPFKRNASGDPDLELMSKLQRADPQRARRLAKEAGEDYDKWFPNNPR